MDSHNVGRGRGSVEIALHEIKAKVLAIGIETDILFPLTEQQFIAASIHNGKFVSINSLYGHDGFLLEAEQIQHIINSFLVNTKQSKILNIK
jgi:homoserine O-acetyltransferase